MNTTGNNWNNQPGLTGLIYSWYKVGDSTALLSSTTATSYPPFTLTQNGNEYYLVITNADGFSLKSNIITINYQNKSLAINATLNGNEVKYKYSTTGYYHNDTKQGSLAYYLKNTYLPTS